MNEGEQAASPNDVIERFAAARPRFQRAANEVLRILAELLAEAGIEATRSARVKDVDSFRAKLALRTDYTDPWAQMTDKVGARAIVHRASQVDEIHRLIEADGRLTVYDVTDKRKMLGEKELGYSGLHLDIYAPAEPDDSEPIPCELQIRTIAQHAWSEVSHKLLYKPAVELDEADRRAIWRLVALVEVFDGEVGRVMGSMPAPTEPAPTTPDTPDLVALVSAHYALFEENSGRRELTVITMDAVADALRADGVTGYAAALNEWVVEHVDSLRNLYDDYGPRSDMATVADYVLWSQPESIGLLESLDRRPHHLLAAWRERGLDDRWLKSLAAHTGAGLEFG